jgi:ATP-dependent DNA helicase RecG
MIQTPTTTNLQSLASQGESLILEFKLTTAERKEACQTVCGMLNASGGTVLIGVTNSGKILGQEVSDQTLRDVQLELQKLEPSYSPQVSTIGVDNNKAVIVITANQSSQGPYTYDGKPYLREGNTTAQMKKDEYENRLMEKMHASSRWENQISNKSIDDLDHHEIILTLEEAIRIGRLNDPKTRDIVAILQGFGLLQDGKLMNAAAALFIKEDRVLPEYTNLCLKMARFKGNNKNEFIDSKTFYGNAFSIYKQAQNFLIQHLPIAGKFIPGVFERQDEPLYPMSALREAIANAICHREYGEGGSNVSIAIFDDRLEIGSTGGLHFGLTVEDLFRDHVSRLWNPLIAEIFYKRGVIEAWGRGTLRIKEDIEQAGLVSPRYKIITGSLILVLSPERQVHSGSVSVELNERQKFIANIFYNNPNNAFPLREICSIVNDPEIKKGTVRNDLHILKSLQVINANGIGAGSKWSLIKVKRKTQ